MWIDGVLQELNKDIPALPNEIPTWPGMELECKIDVGTLQAQVAGMLRKLAEYPVIAYRQLRRTETHYVYSSGRVIAVLTAGEKEVWIKQKQNPRILHTPTNRVPVLMREEILSNPHQSDYQQRLMETLNMKHIGRFHKELLDIWFWYKDLHFTLTVADATTAQAVLSQVEIEYDGHHPHLPPPTIEHVLEMYDELMTSYLPGLIPYAVPLTKFEWLTQVPNQ